MVCFRGSKNYAKSFTQQVQSLEMWFHHAEMGESLLQFMRLNGCNDIKKIKFCGVNWSKSFADECDFFVQNVEIVSFYVLWSKRHDVHLDEIVKHLPLLSHLKVVGYETKLPTIKLSRLVVFEYDISIQPNLEDLENFLQQNPTVRRCTVHVYSHNINFIQRLLKIVSKSSIAELFLECDKEIDFALIRNELTQLDERKNFKRLELKILANHMRNPTELAFLKSFNGFHLKHDEVSSMNRYIRAFSSYVNLTTLWIEAHVSEAFAENLSQNLRNLQEFYFDGYQIWKTIAPFVRYSPKLKKIIVLNSCSDEDDEDEYSSIATLNAERKMLEDATELTIYLAAYDRVEYILTPNDDCSNELVQVKHIIMSESDDPELRNPLISYKFSCEEI